jgi:hypothetical protein
MRNEIFFFFAPQKYWAHLFLRTMFMIIWRMSCLVASEAVHKYMCKVLPGPKVARRYQRFYAGGFDRVLEPTVIAMQPNMQIEKLEFCRLSEAGQHGLIGLKSSKDQAVEKHQGEFQSFQQTLHSEVRSWKAYLIAKSEHEDEAASHQTSAKDGSGSHCWLVCLLRTQAHSAGPVDSANDPTQDSIGAPRSWGPHHPKLVTRTYYLLQHTEPT